MFFPIVSGAEDPVWPNAARNAFMRAAYGLIDFYLEEEKALRLQAQKESMDERTLETKIDQLWGKVTLFNCYQLFTRLSSKKIQNPIHREQRKLQAMEKREDITFEELQEQIKKTNRLFEREGDMWDNKAELDALTLFFNATQQLPGSPMRGLVNDADNALKSMAGAEKMLASVYGIAITAMNFFTDPTIATLTSGTPSQNVDLSTLSFPRKFGIRFTVSYLERMRLVGAFVHWQAYTDASFTKTLDEKIFSHDSVVTREGWAQFVFDGIFPENVGYVKLVLSDPNTKLSLKSFYFKFTKDYRKSLDGRFYVKCPILEERIVKGGQLEELLPRAKGDGNVVYVKGKTTILEERVADITGTQQKRQVKVPVIRQVSVRYEEKPKIIFLVTPPHLKQYAKLILILLKQLVDLNFGQSYLTKANQKPLYKTRYMLDEVGNLESDGAGIDGLQTMLSIGLGQDQLFTLILQTLQQLRDVYGDSVDKIVQGNTANIVFLKSTDDSMIDTLVKMSGTTHQTYTDSMTVTMDKERVINEAKGEVSYTTTTKEEPVISYNNLAFMPERNSIVFRAGDAPIWNRNETILPMSWKLLHEKRIKVPGKDYTVQTIPSLSQVTDFNVRQNTPDFMAMLDKRVRQAAEVKDAAALYAKVYNYSEVDIYRLDPEAYSDELMQIINTLRLHGFEGTYADKQKIEEQQSEKIKREALENKEMNDVIKQGLANQKNLELPRYAEGQISRHDLKPYGNQRSSNLYSVLQKAYAKSKQFFNQDELERYAVGDDYTLYSSSGIAYILRIDDQLRENLAKRAKEPESNVYGDGNIKEEEWASYQIQDAFIDHLVELDDWRDLAKGEFDKAVANELKIELVDAA